MTLSIELSYPEPCLWPNARPDRHAKSDVARQGRNEAYVVTLAALEGRTITAAGLEIPVKVIGYKPAEHGQDKDGFLAACKSRLDGIAQALRLNDVHFDPRVEWGECRPPHGRVVVEVAL